MTGGLLVAETHPIQYHVPVYRLLQQQFGVPVTVAYGSDFSVHRYRDQEFGADVTWDVDLLGGYTPRFLATVDRGGERDPLKVSARGIGRIFDEVRPAAALAVGYSPAFHRRAWAAASRRAVPVLFRGEATDLGQTTNRGRRLVRDAVLRLAYRRCARVLYIGERARRHYRSLGVGDDRLVFSPYCVDLAPFRAGEIDRDLLRPAARRELKIGDDQLVLVFSGKLSPRKGVDLVLPAVRALPEALRAKVVVLCLGDGVSREALHRQAAEGPAVPIVVAGVQPQAALSRWYHASDLLILPSRHGETWGLVVNEALHHGLPVVVSDQVGCAPDLVTAETGSVCEAGSSEALAVAIQQAARLVGRREVRDACRRRVSGYTLERAAAGLAEAYRAAIAERPVR